MQYFDKVHRCALAAVVLAGASLGTAHATFPGENGDIVYGVYKFDFNNTVRAIKKVRPGSGIPSITLAAGFTPRSHPTARKLRTRAGPPPIHKSACS